MMAETKAVASAAAPAEEGRSKTVVLVAVDDSDHSYRALEWAVRHVAATAGVPGARAVELVVVHAKPSPSPVVTMGGPGVSGDVVRLVEADLRKKADGVVDRARRLCVANSVTSVQGVVEVVDGEPRHVLCNAVEKHHADLLVVGSHGYGAIKRALLGSVSDYCAHHAHCSVMIVKQPKPKN
uniref:UspA domain-containing protein n=1 Tax=Triticum urartu TaxID=4572 RepID=A0A8R7PAH7_TRIUA